MLCSLQPVALLEEYVEADGSTLAAHWAANRAGALGLTPIRWITADSPASSRASPLWGWPSRALAHHERTLGPDHIDTVACRHNLARAYEEGGDLKRAIPLYERALQDAERTLGETHPLTLASRNNLADAHRAAGSTDRALDLLEQNVALGLLQGTDELSTLAAITNSQTAVHFRSRSPASAASGAPSTSRAVRSWCHRRSRSRPCSSSSSSARVNLPIRISLAIARSWQPKKARLQRRDAPPSP
ncbi:tetratricopeptide repeat protein [Streptomyces sp. NBC_00249]|nr:tetratricopeptide repeat protein [Streptomyces sp. NBC_00249]